MTNSRQALPSRVAATLITLLCFQSAFSTHAAATDDDDTLPVEVICGDKAGGDLFLGDWQGTWSKGWPRELVAQVIPRGGQNYDINFLPAFDQRCAPLAVIQARASGRRLQFDQDGWSGAIEGDRFTGTGILRKNPVPFELAKVIRLSPRLGARPPKGAVVLLDGGDLAEWETTGRGGAEEITWKTLKGFVRTWPPLKEHAFGASIRTRRAWPSFRLHVEFRLPLIAAATGQTRANSGVIIEEFEFFEVQILDSYGLPGYWDETGAIYKKEAPKVNMCAPPGQWQSYDIIYSGPRFDATGNLVSKPRITVDLNGKTIHNDVELPYSERALKARREKSDSKTPGRIVLQHHGDPVDFRNVWIVECSDRK